MPALRSQASGVARAAQLVQAVGGQAHGQHRLGAGALVTVQHPQVARLAVGFAAGHGLDQRLDVAQAQVQPLARQRMQAVRGIARQRDARRHHLRAFQRQRKAMQLAAHRQLAQPALGRVRQQSFQRGGLLALRQGQQPRRGLFAHGPDHRHLRAVGRVRQRQQRQHAVVAEPLNGGALVRPFGVQVHHQSGVLVRHRLVFEASGLAQRRGRAVGAHEQLGADAGPVLRLDLAVGVARAAVLDPGNAEQAHGLDQHALDLARFDDPGQLRQRRLPGVEMDLAVGVAVDLHGLYRRQPGGGHGVPDAQAGQEPLAGRGDRVHARVVVVGFGRRHRGARGQHGHALPAPGQRQGGRQADDAGPADYDLMSHRALGSPACLGHSSHIWPRCFMRPACCPASSP